MYDVAQKPMLVRLVRELPTGDVLYEPKWDGFRCLAYRDGGHVELRSRHGRPFARYFPEIVAALAAMEPARVALDGELLVLAEGRFDFAALMARLHPAASRVRELASRTPAVFVAFDLLGADDEDLRAQPFRERRARLVERLGDARPPLFITPATPDRAVAAAWLERFRGGGLDGVVAKPCDGRYEPGVRAMMKVKHERTADCVVAGLRATAGPPTVTALLLGLFDDEDRLEHIGVASSFGRAAGERLARDLPLAPQRVCEVSYTQIDGRRLRHPAKLVRWRPDREASSCRIEQLEEPLDAPGRRLGA